MGISDFRIQYILRSYSRQLANRAWVPRRYIKEEEVTLSAESKERLLLDSTVQEIMGQFTSESRLNGRARDILERLSLEYGQTLEISNHEGQGIVFKVLDKGSGEVKPLSASENERLEKRLFDLTQSTVYDDLVKISTISQSKIS